MSFIISFLVPGLIKMKIGEAQFLLGEDERSWYVISKARLFELGHIEPEIGQPDNTSQTNPDAGYGVRWDIPKVVFAFISALTM